MDIFGSGQWWVSGGLGIACLALYLAYRFKKRISYFEERGFPTLPLFRTIYVTLRLFTFRINFIDFIDEIYRYFEGQKIGGYYQLGGNVMLVRDPDLINRILIKDFSYFHDHGFEVDTELNPLEGHLFNMNGAKWRALRNKLSPTFTTGKLKGMLSQMSDCSDNLISVLKENKPQEDIMIHDILSRFSIDLIGCCTFGIDAGALENPDCQFRKMAQKIFRPSSFQQLRMMFRMMFPHLALKLKLKTMDDEIVDFFFGLMRQAFEHRIKTGLKRNDFVDLLLQLKLKGRVDCDPKDLEEEDDAMISPGMNAQNQEESEKLVLTDGLLAAQAFVFLIAGWENTAAAISFVLYFLAKHQDVQEKVRQEIKWVKEKHGSTVTYEALKDMVYLDACISESMRLYSPGIGLFHACTKNYTMDDGRVIEKGTTVIIPTFSIQRDVAHFQDAEEFRPERFMPGEHVPNNVYLPFGDGPRVCIARRFVLLEMKLVVAKLVESLKFTVSPKMKEPIKIGRKIFQVQPEGGMWMRVEPLQD